MSEEIVRRREMAAPPPGDNQRLLGHMAAAGPLALAAFAVPLFVWSGFNTHFFNIRDENFIIPLAVFFGGPVAIAAGIWAYTHRDSFLATAAGVFGAFWLTYGLLLWLQHSGVVGNAPTDSTGHMRAFLFVAWAVTFGVLWVGSMRAHWALSLVTLGAGAMFVLLAIAYYHDGVNVQGSNLLRVGGWIGFITAGLAWYSALAELLNAEFERPVLPTSMEWFRSWRPGPS